MSDAVGVKVKPKDSAKTMALGFRISAFGLLSTFGLGASDLYIGSASESRNHDNLTPRSDFKILTSAPKLIVDEKFEFDWFGGSAARPNPG